MMAAFWLLFAAQKVTAGDFRIKINLVYFNQIRQTINVNRPKQNAQTTD